MTKDCFNCEYESCWEYAEPCNSCSHTSNWKAKTVAYGHWEFVASAPWWSKCSQCGCLFSKTGLYNGKANYCPSCGTKMEVNNE